MGQQARNYSQKTIKRLFARSGNQCSYPNCNVVLTNENNALESNICHIEGANVKGERFNPNMTDKERADYSNLILLCKQHHDETNDEAKYTVENLKRMKENHENAIDQRINSDRLYGQDANSIQSLMNFMPFVQLPGIFEDLPYSVSIDYAMPLDVYDNFIKGNPHLYPFKDKVLTVKFDTFIFYLSQLHDILSGSTSRNINGEHELITQKMIINGYVGDMSQCFANYTAANMDNKIGINKMYIGGVALDFLVNEIEKQKIRLMSSYFELIEYIRSHYQTVEINSYKPYKYR